MEEKNYDLEESKQKHKQFLNEKICTKSQQGFKSGRHYILTTNVNKITRSCGNDKLCKNVLHIIQTIKLWSKMKNIIIKKLRNCT